MLLAIDGEGERLYSEHLFCPFDGISFEELAPRNFSFNSPHGACPDCTGLGVKKEIDPDLVHTPAIFVQRVFKATRTSGFIERRTVRKRP